MADLGRVAAKGAGVTVTAQLIRFALQIVSLAVISRYLTPAEVGLVAMVTAVLNVAEIIRDFGLSAAAIQSPTLSRAERANLFWINLALGAACSVAAAASAPALAHFYDDPAVMPIVLALSGMFVISGANTQFRADLSRGYRFRALAVTEVSAQATAMAVGISAAVAGAGSWAIVAQQITLVTVTLIMNAAQCGWIPGWPDRNVPMRRFLVFGSHLLGTNLMGFVVNNVDNVALGVYWGPSALGLYTRAYQLVQVPLQQVNAPLGRVALPIMSRIKDQHGDFQRFFQRFQLAVSCTLGLGFALVAGLSTPVVNLLFGPAWAGVAPILAVLAVGGVFKSIDSANYQVWVAKGLTGQLLRLYAITRPLMIVAILAGIPWGPIGVAYGHLVAAVGFWAANLWILSRHANLDWRLLMGQTLRIMWFVIAPSGVMAYAGSLLVGGSMGAIVCGLLLAGLWVCLAVAVVRPVRTDLLPLWLNLRPLLRSALGR